MGITAGFRRGLAGAPRAFSEAQRREPVLAWTRLAISVFSFVAIRYDPRVTGGHPLAAQTALAAYVLYSLFIVGLTPGSRRRTSSFVFSIHAADLLWPALISLLTGGPESPCFLLFAFAVFGAAYRWGFEETIATASAGVLIFGWEAAWVLSEPGGRFLLPQRRFHLAEFIVEVAGLLIAGVLLGFLAEREKVIRSRNFQISRILRTVDPEAGVTEILEDAARATLKLFDGGRIVAIVNHSPTGHAFKYEAGNCSEGDQENRLSELTPAEREQYFFPTAGPAWYLQRKLASSAYRLMAFDSKGRRLAAPSGEFPESFSSRCPFQLLFGVTFVVGREWSGRVFLSDPRNGSDLESDLRFFQLLVVELAAAIHSVYQLRRLRSRASAIERARVARDLHDGVIQDLIALEMQVDEVRRQAGGVSQNAAGELEHVRNLLRQEVTTLRELVEQLKLDDAAPGQFLGRVAQLVEGFERRTGISATFDSDLETAPLPPHIAREVASIVQEALTNVRKHSGAHHVQIHFGKEDHLWKLVVEDDGRGFQFSGRLSHRSGGAVRGVPRVIRERVESIRGELIIDSRPGLGSRLEVRFSPGAHG